MSIRIAWFIIVLLIYPFDTNSCHAIPMDRMILTVYVFVYHLWHGHVLLYPPVGA